MTDQTCESCKHWFRFPPQTPDGGRSSVESPDGSCQHFPPQLGADLRFHFPVLRQALTCGEYSARTLRINRPSRLKAVDKPRR